MTVLKDNQKWTQFQLLLMPLKSTKHLLYLSKQHIMVFGLLAQTEWRPFTHSLEHTWPDLNKLGHINSEIASRIRYTTDRSHFAPGTAPKDKTKSQSNTQHMPKELKKPGRRNCSGKGKFSSKSQVRDSKKRDFKGQLHCILTGQIIQRRRVI